MHFLFPSPSMNPPSQAQSNEPALFTHRWSHPPLLSRHSFTSERWRGQKKNELKNNTNTRATKSYDNNNLKQSATIRTHTHASVSSWCLSLLGTVYDTRVAASACARRAAHQSDACKRIHARTWVLSLSDLYKTLHCHTTCALMNTSLTRSFAALMFSLVYTKYTTASNASERALFASSATAASEGIYLHNTIHLMNLRARTRASPADSTDFPRRVILSPLRASTRRESSSSEWVVVAVSALEFSEF